MRASLVGLLFLAGCTAVDGSSNPLLGRWAVEAPGAVFNLGTAEFRNARMTGFGLDQEVRYVVEGDAVRIMPVGFGPQLEATLVDKDTARLGSPLFGQIVTLRRIR
jgi:hypothetical protein